MLKLFLLTTLLLPILSLKSPAPPTSPHTSPTVSILGPPSTPTVWTHFASLQTPQTLNLGQGYPSSSPPKFCLDSLKESIESSSRIHQYTASAGHPPLVSQLCQRYSNHLSYPVTSDNVAITVGASQSLYLCLQTLINPGDEVLIFEPYFDLYINQIKLSGGTPIPVPLDYKLNPLTGCKEWLLNPSTLKSKITSKTRCLIFNSPHNPTGKVFTHSEMSSISTIISPHEQITVLSDEVYKYIIHSPPSSNPSTSPPGHFHFSNYLPERTITISSAGKTFSSTGWQVGWSVGPKNLIEPIKQILPYVQFCTSSLMQDALARALPLADQVYSYEGKEYDSYYDYLREGYIEKRDTLILALEKAGFDVPDYSKVSGGGFFVLAGITDSVKSRIPTEYLKGNTVDWGLCEYFIKEVGVGMIPSSPFFGEGRREEGEKWVRVAFCGEVEDIEEAGRRIRCKEAGEVESCET
ncbi:hypothetical protein TrLO_g3757 [Triparma laevis f. longispina]|uniref:Aminotransferase class I/classII large domain-containing protein n=1 Tax=Triparma laevis f. longispina TaxID=1714387 RepID=A0A9W7FRG0_9STRA|nr:hypothetical protein TrLO_g3757 [Triparma laevis f. longispina]